MLLHERLLESKLKDKDASWFMEQDGYAERFEHVKKKSALAIGKRYSDADTMTLGAQFKMFENYTGFVETYGGTAELGEVPRVGLDVIAGIYGNSIVNFVGQTQNLKEEEGLIYYKQVRAGTTRGNVTQDQLIRDARRSAAVYQRGYAGEKQRNIPISSTSAGLQSYNIALPQSPIKPGSVELAIPGMNLDAFDNRKGSVVGTNIQGTINYDLGTVTFQLLVAPAGVNDIIANYDTDYEKNGNSLPIIKTGFDKVNVKAEILALKGQTSIYKDFAAQNRFGQSAQQDMVNTLINEITAEINYRVSEDILAAAQGETLFDPTPAFGVSQYEHKQAFMDAWAMAQVKMRRQSGRASIQTILAGDYVCAMFDTMPKFVPTNIVVDGPSVYGTIDNKVVIRCPNYDPLVAVGVYKGDGQFNTGYMYAPYMPIYVDGSIPSPDSVVIKEGLVTVWSAFQTLIPNYFTLFRLTKIPNSQYIG